MMSIGDVDISIAQFLGPSLATPQDVALIILNTPIAHYNVLEKLYAHSSYRICADGGANRLYNLLLASTVDERKQQRSQSMLPDAIHGDLDSLNDDVRQAYQRLGVEVTHDPDQYSTDFGKAIKKVKAHMPNVQNILVHGSIGGRVDQGIGLLHELYREQVVRNEDVRIWLFSESSITILLRPGKTVLQTPLSEGLIRRNVGILPLYGLAHITTKGLEWDVVDWPTDMGSQVSTSNHIVADSISIETDKEVVFTVEMAVKDQAQC